MTTGFVSIFAKQLIECFWVMKMQKRIKGILLVVVMGIIIPSITMRIAKKAHIKKPMETVQTVATEETVQITTEKNADDSYKIPVLLDNGSLIQMDLEDYIVGVVLAEMPTEFEKEALKAQAVVARTYALKRNLHSQKHTDQAVCTDPSCCQAYCEKEKFLASGGTNTDIQKVEDAVYQTKNEVLTYDSELIDATYFSASGGKTEDAKAVWGSDVPYLQSVDSPGEEDASYHVNTVYFTFQEFADCLQIDSKSLTDSWIGNVTYTNGGGVEKITICNQIYSGTQIRKLLGLRSTAFVMTAVGNTVTVTTKGFGHRVGMSQYGADAMAVSGKDYTEILSHYYQGTVLEKMQFDKN